LPRRSIWAALALIGALVATGAALPANADVVGSGPGTISGTVTTSDGQPVEGASVYIGGPVITSASTDASGYYEASGLELGTYYLSTYLAGHQQVPSQEALLTVESATSTNNFVLVPYAVADGSISGQVTTDGVPLANHDITAYQQSTGQNVFGLTDGDGNYQFTGLGYGEWTVNIFLGQDYQYLNPVYVQLSASAPAGTINFPFLSWPVGTSSISGTATDSATGEPLAGVQIFAWGSGVGRSYSTSTDESGVYTFELLPADSYFLGSWSPGYLSTYNYTALLVGADEAASYDLALIAADATISGHVEDAAGNPVVGINVSAYSGDNGSGAYTDENGDYVISEVGAIEYTVFVGGVSTPYKPQEKLVTPIAGADIVANFAMEDRTTGYLTGFVLAPDGAAYAPTACVTLYSSKNKKPVAVTETFGSELGDGTYSFDSIEPGSYTVEVRDCDGIPTTKFDKVFLGGVKNFKDATFVTIVAAGDSVNNDITVTPR